MKFLQGLAISSLLISASQGYAATNYSVTDLGTLGGLVQGGTYSQATAINNNGQIVGVSYPLGSSNAHAFMYSNGVMTDMTPTNSGYTNALGINDLGVVVGEANGQPYIYTNGNFNYLGFSGTANSINNNNVVVGTNFSNHQAFIYANGSVHYLGNLGGMASEAFGISNAGLVVGDSFTQGNNAIDAFIYTNGQMQDLGIQYTSTYANSVNDAGIVVGRTKDSAFVYQAGSVFNIGATYFSGQYSVATDINNLGQVVGWHSGTTTGAFLYEDGNLQDLSGVFAADGWTNVIANSINDSGQIVGEGIIGGKSHAFLATPMIATVPEPETYAMMLAGLGLVGTAVRKHHKRS